MLRKRMYRDLGILAGFLGAFFVVVTFVNQLDAVPENADVNVSQMSTARLNADIAREQADEEELIENLKLMVEADPYNGLAWFQLGNCYFAQLFDLEFDGIRVERDGSGAVTLLDVNTAKEPAETVRLRKRLQQKANEAQLQAFQFARFRGSAMLQLARIASLQGEREVALDWLTQFYDMNYIPPGGLRSYVEFQSLKSDPRFESLTQQDDDRWWSQHWRR